MQQRTIRVNASEETIKIGPLGIRFLLTGDDSNGSGSVFEVLVPAGQKLAAPAHKNDAYEEILYGIEGVLTWTVDGTPIKSRSLRASVVGSAPALAANNTARVTLVMIARE